MTTTEGTGGEAFANKNCLQGRAFEQFFQIPGVCPGVCPGRMLAAENDSHIICVFLLYCALYVALVRTIDSFFYKNLFLYKKVRLKNVQ